MNRTAKTAYAAQVEGKGTIVRAGVGVVILDALGRVLLEKRSDNSLWGLPGGRIEPGESIEQAAIREVFEETGLAVRITGLRGVYSDPSDRIVTYPDNVVHLVDIVLDATIVSGALVCSNESESLEFFDPSNLPADLAPPACAPLSDFVSGIAVVVR